VPDEDADNDFLPTDNGEEDFGDEVPDEDADDNFSQLTTVFVPFQ
jgi:hypothetical protein